MIFMGYVSFREGIFSLSYRVLKGGGVQGDYFINH